MIRPDDPYADGRRQAEALADKAPPLTDEEIEEMQVLLGDALTPRELPEQAA